MSANELRLLYIEADKHVRASVVTLLNNLQCTVTEASNSSTAIAQLESDQAFDLILLGDLTRPAAITAKGPQAELAIIQKARTLFQELPILVFTNHNYLPAAYAHGITAHLLKPADPKEIIGFLSPYLSRIQSQDLPPTNDPPQGNK